MGRRVEVEVGRFETEGRVQIRVIERFTVCEEEYRLQSKEDRTVDVEMDTQNLKLCYSPNRPNINSQLYIIYSGSSV